MSLMPGRNWRTRPRSMSRKDLNGLELKMTTSSLSCVCVFSIRARAFAGMLANFALHKRPTRVAEIRVRGYGNDDNTQTHSHRGSTTNPSRHVAPRSVCMLHENTSTHRAGMQYRDVRFPWLGVTLAAPGSLPPKAFTRFATVLDVLEILRAHFKDELVPCALHCNTGSTGKGAVDAS